MENKFIIYLVNQIPNKHSISLPEGTVITKLNNQVINNYMELKNINNIDKIDFYSGKTFYL